MNIRERRKAILNEITKLKEPITATQLGKKFGVSRQVIVNDVSFIRERGFNIISTNKGYIFPRDGVTREIKVIHDNDKTKDELYTIVDCGASVVDVYIFHDVYGRIDGELDIKNRREADEFIEGMKKIHINYLNDLTNGIHYHTIKAKDEKTLDYVVEKLEEKGYIVD